MVIKISGLFSNSGIVLNEGRDEWIQEEYGNVKLVLKALKKVLMGVNDSLLYLLDPLSVSKKACRQVRANRHLESNEKTHDFV